MILPFEVDIHLACTIVGNAYKSAAVCGCTVAIIDRGVSKGV